MPSATHHILDDAEIAKLAPKLAPLYVHDDLDEPTDGKQVTAMIWTELGYGPDDTISSCSVERLLDAVADCMFGSR